MKTIINNLRFALLLGFIAIGMTALAQEIPNVNKMSATTQLLLAELDNANQAPLFTTNGPKLTPKHPGQRRHRLIASPDTINGSVFISAFVRVNSDSDISDLEALGVQIESKFDNGLLTTLIPVDKINEVAAIEGVKKISVASLMRPLTDKARQTTNTDDVLTLSADALAANLSHIYDGTGVILGVIDGGIDYQHSAFKDKNGNTRIKGVYCYNGSTTTTWSGSGTMPTTDDNSGDHGTHTSSIAGGSSVIVNGSNVTVTDNHANATYGGMAPGADLFLAGTNDLADTRIVAAMQQMFNYARAQNKPLVVSNSWGTHMGPHDGTGYMAEVVGQYFGDNHPNNFCLFAVGNEAGNADPSEGGGYYISGNASSNNPLGTIIRNGGYSDADNGMVYDGIIANAWCRSTSVTDMACKIYVLNANTGAIVTSVTVNPTTSGTTVSGLSNYYSGSLVAVKDYQERVSGYDYNKTQILLFSNNGIQSRSYTQSGNIYVSNYTLAIEFYPTNGTATIDVWAADSFNYFTNYLTTNGHNWVNGTDDMTAGDEVTIADAISVGAYNARTSFTNSQGQNINYSSVLTLNDITYFSSYATPGTGPTGLQYPCITAPGARVISAVNHNHTTAVDAYSYYGSNYISDLVVNSSSSPYAAMDGTSMACPAAAGIVALWMQAAQEVGKTLTTTEIKNIMAETAIKDSWVTSGPNASQFGNGKINALGGIEYILNEYGEPTITATPSTVTFDGAPGGTYTQTVTVGGIQLTNDIIAELNDQTGTFSINRATNLGSGGDLVITYAPTDQGNHNATITLTSIGATSQTITLNGTSRIVTEATVADGTTTNANVPVYGNYFSRTQTNQMLYPASRFAGTGMDGKTIKKFTFYPSNGINFYRRNNQSATVTVKLANMPSGTTGYTYNNPTRKNADFVTVKTMTMPNSTQPNLREWVFEDLDNDFVYTGGDLLIEVTTTVGTNGATNFYGEELPQQVYQSYYSYSGTTGGTTSRGLRFLPKVTFEWDAPFMAGTVSPSSLTFSDAIIDNEATQTVTVTNTGNIPFTPVIDTTNLPAEFTVTGSGAVAIGGSLDLTVTYSPTNAGPHSGSFTVTIGDQTYTVSVTGNGVNVSSTLFSNEVMVPVYKSDIRANGDTYIFAESDVLGDIDMSLEYPANSSSIEVLAKADEPILRYDLHHKIGEDGNWTYPDGAAVATATHNGNSYVVNSETFTFPQDATEMWISMNDSQLNNATEVTYYVPVTIANGKVTTGEPNTYGAPFAQSQLDPVSIEVRVGGVKSSVIDHYGNHTGEWEGPNGVNYCVYMPVVTVLCQQLNGTTHVPYLYRAWLLANDFVDYYNYAHDPQEGFYGTTVKQMPYLLAEKGIDDIGDPTYVTLGEAGDTYEGQNTFGAPVDDPSIVIAVRVYYQRADELSGHMLRAGGGYGFGQGSGRGDGIQTGINELINGKQVVDVQYVNTLGMQSSEPFDGVNIVITRYSDGSTSTAKVVK